MSTGWQATAKNKAASVLALIPPEWRLPNIPTPQDQRDVTGPYIQQFLTPEEIEITETDAVGIVARTTTGRWKSVDVARAFCHRAALAHQLVNCLHEIFFEHALETAAALDAFFAKHRRPIGPLHGLPVSLKDQFHVKGVETHMGYTGWIGTFQGKKGTGKERVFESEMVRELRSLGAVLFVKTSVPHTLMAGETMNNITGYTSNAKNRNLSSGGSSGGEGTLISLRGSPVGFGTDIGGSIRIPSAFNGLYGIRPSTGRMPYEGMANSMDGQNSVISVVGPLATTLEALNLVMEALLSTKPWLHDPLVHEIPWRPEAARSISSPLAQAKHPLSFGVLRDDGEVTVHPPVTRAVNLVAAALQKRGHSLVDWQPNPTHPEIVKLVYDAWFADGGDSLREDFATSGEDVLPQALIPDNAALSPLEMMRVNVAKRDAQKAYLDYWNASAKLTGTGEPVDAVICPVAPFAAARPEKFTYYAYSIWVNGLDLTSVVIPVTKVDKKVDLKLEGFKARNEADQLTQDTYDPEIYDGAFVGIQLVGRRLQEEKMLALAKYVSEALQEL